MRFWRAFPFFACLILTCWPSAVSASSIEVTAESTWQFEILEPSTVYIYGNTNRSCSETTADPHLWLYDSTGALIAQDDDSNHNAQNQCVSSKIVIELEPDAYTIVAGYCCRQLGAGATPTWGDGTYELQILDHDLTDPTSTATTTIGATTTLPVPETTTTSTTTTLPVPETTTTSTTTTTIATTTTLPVPETTTTSTTTTTIAATTTSITPAEETTTTWPATTTSTAATTTSTTIAPTTTATATTPVPTSTEPTISSTVSPTAPPTTPAPTLDVPPAIVQPANDAPIAERLRFEQQTNIFDGTHDDYVPVGSTITVAQRRTVITATLVASPILYSTPGRKRR